MKSLSFYSQAEGAEYLQRKHGLEITAPELSVLCKFHLGPKHGTKGRMKVMTEYDLEQFAAQQKRLAKQNSDNSATEARA